MTFREPIGVYEQLSTRREQHTALVANMSPAARHAHLPSKYAKPVPYDRKPTAAELQELERLRNENTRLRARVSGLEARVEFLLKVSGPAASSGTIKQGDPFPGAAVDRAISIICKHWGTSPAALQCHSRERRFSRPRQAAYKLLVEEIHLSRANVGKFFRRDHTTVMHGLQKTLELAADPIWSGRYAAALAEFRGEAP